MYPGPCYVLERSVGTLRFLVVHNGVTLGEGTTLDILTGNTDVVALLTERTEGESLSGRHVDVLALGDRLRAVGQDTLKVLVDLDVLTRLTNDLGDVLEVLGGNSSGQVGQDLGGELLGRLEAVPGAGQPLLGGGSVVLGAREGLLEHAPDPLSVFINILLGETTILQKLVDVNIDLWLVCLNTLVHQWLSERWLISLVMAVLAVAN